MKNKIELAQKYCKPSGEQLNDIEKAGIIGEANVWVYIYDNIVLPKIQRGEINLSNDMKYKLQGITSFTGELLEVGDTVLAIFGTGLRKSVIERIIPDTENTWKRIKVKGLQRPLASNSMTLYREPVENKLSLFNWNW